MACQNEAEIRAAKRSSCFKWSARAVAAEKEDDLAGCQAVKLFLDQSQMTYDAAKAKSCLDALDAANCARFDDDENESLEIEDCFAYVNVKFTSVPVGGDCGLQPFAVCQDGWCDAIASGCAGKCQAFLATGAPCDPNVFGFLGQCGPRAFCKKNEVNPAAGTCQPAPKLNEACEFFCDEGLFCDRSDFPQPGVCRALRSQGETCPASFACAAGLFCDDRVTPNVCNPPVGLATEGEKCSLGVRCGVGLYCERTAVDSFVGTCKQEKTSGACNAFFSFDGSECAVGYDCIAPPTAPEAGECVQVKALDDDCSALDACAPGYFCDPAAKKCKPTPIIGEVCAVAGALLDDDDVCITGWCSGGGSEKCEAYRKVGEACEDDEQCEDECDDGPGGTLKCIEERPPVCTPPPATGALGGPCGTGGLCDAGLYCRDSDTTCRNPLAVGSLCDELDACGSSAVCLVLIDPIAQCFEIIPEGGDCSGSPPEACAEGTTCDDAGLCTASPPP